ncbi:cystatin-A-like [Crassostrea angulata]|uniref:cystatin-A-like n=1 Tax=Magallana angulata TaxID=2784310 RepID=UPI0022B0FE49|nr:cystatin-A-like [Crassostrea angulata]
MKSLSILLIVILPVIHFSQAEVYGGYGPEILASPNIQALVDKHTADIYRVLPLGFYQGAPGPPVLRAVTYRMQIVAGSNYLIKVNTGYNRFIFVNIFKDLSNNSRVINIRI